MLQADGGTRTAAISGAYVAMADAVNWLVRQKLVAENPVHRAVAAVSVGILEDEVITDLDYAEDSRAATDMNVVMDDRGGLIEVQGTAEGEPFSRETLEQMLNQARDGIAKILEAQQAALRAE